MSSKFDQIYKQVLDENTIPATNTSTPNVNVSKEVQDFFNKHQANPGFFEELVKQLDVAQKAQKAQPQQNQQPQANQQQNGQQQPQANQQQNGQQPQANQQQNGQQAGQQQNQQQKKI